MPETGIRIMSAQNPSVKALKKLQHKKYRDERGLFVIENPLTVRDGIARGAVAEELYLTPAFEERYGEAYRKIISAVPAEKVYRVTDAVLASCVSLEQPQGIAAVYAKPAERVDTERSVVFLNGIADPGNVGAIVRSCAAFGIASVVGDQESADFFNPKAVSAAKESIFSVGLSRSSAGFLRRIQKNMPVYGLEAHGDSFLAGVPLKHPLCLVFGSEAHGLGDDVRSYVDKTVTIPIDTSRVESLNVAAAAAIVLQLMRPS
ncbi:MAG: RNA methyltransferase [Patescibacteria group bacterium]